MKSRRRVTSSPSDFSSDNEKTLTHMRDMSRRRQLSDSSSDDEPPARRRRLGEKAITSRRRSSPKDRRRVTSPLRRVKHTPERRRAEFGRKRSPHRSSASSDERRYRFAFKPINTSRTRAAFDLIRQRSSTTLTVKHAANRRTRCNSHSSTPSDYETRRDSASTNGNITAKSRTSDSARSSFDPRTPSSLAESTSVVLPSCGQTRQQLVEQLAKIEAIIVKYSKKSTISAKV